MSMRRVVRIMAWGLVALLAATALWLRLRLRRRPAARLAPACPRVVDLLVLTDGSVLVSDDRAGVVYRTTYAPQ